jgi:hypothetical protein
MSDGPLWGLPMNFRNGRKCSFILIITLLIAISVLFGAVNGEQYTDSKGRYKIDFPSGWEQSEIAGIDVVYYDLQEDDFRENINIISASMGGVKNTEKYVLDAADEAISGLKQQFPGTTVFSEAEAKIIKDHWSVTYILDVEYDWGTSRQSQTLIVSEGYTMVFVITCTALPSTFSSFQSQFDQSTNSFEILNEPEPEEDSFWEGFIIFTIAGALIGGTVAGLGGFLIMKKKKKEEQERMSLPQDSISYSQMLEDYERQYPPPPPQPPPPT